MVAHLNAKFCIIYICNAHVWRGSLFLKKGNFLVYILYNNARFLLMVKSFLTKDNVNSMGTNLCATTRHVSPTLYIESFEIDPCHTEGYIKSINWCKLYFEIISRPELRWAYFISTIWLKCAWNFLIRACTRRIKNCVF